MEIDLFIQLHNRLIDNFSVAVLLLLAIIFTDTDKIKKIPTKWQHIMIEYTYISI